MFPPWESSYLYPTRIPYEESSVFSEVNVKNPDLQQHPQFKVFSSPKTSILNMKFLKQKILFCLLKTSHTCKFQAYR